MNYKSKSTLEKLKLKMRVMNYSNSTIKTYCNCCYKFMDFFDVDIYHIPVKQAKEKLETMTYTSVSQQNQMINAIKLLYKLIVGLKLNHINFTRPRKEKHLPRVIDKNHVLNSIEKITNTKHKAIISLAYSVGLRVSEVINLKIEDIDSKRMVINVIQAKGRKDRVVPLSQKILTILRNYFTEYKPNTYLFNGQKSLQYSSTSCNKIVKKYLGEEYHFHLLRHSCFTNLTDEGVDLRSIQKLAGHTSSKTTEIYTHVSQGVLQKLPLAI